MPTKLPEASYALMPSSFMVAAASLDGAASFMSMLFNCVPASAPMVPFWAKRLRTPVVSWMLMPKLLACAPQLLSASPKSLTLPTALPAPAASVSATCEAWLPDKWNIDNALAMYSAASPTAMPSEAARLRAPVRPPESMSVTLMPALPRSLIASADSLAE